MDYTEMKRIGVYILVIIAFWLVSNILRGCRALLALAVLRHQQQILEKAAQRNCGEDKLSQEKGGKKKCKTQEQE